MNREHPPDGPVGQDRREPRRVRLPGFISDEDVGLGDVLKKATSIVGIRPCGGCAERARRLNNWMVFSKRR
ncbi:MAG: hypothetical protein ABIZ05_05195 [Pseudonocardiaceae bacterium]